MWLLQFTWLEIFDNEEFLIHRTIQSSGVVLRGVLDYQLTKLFVHYDMGYKSKNLRAAVRIFNVQVNRIFVKMHAENLMKVTKLWKLWAEKDHLI